MVIDILHYKIFSGSNFNVPAIPDNSIHIEFTSPPYGLKDLITYNANDPDNLGNYKEDEFLQRIKPSYKEAYRVLKPGRKLLLNVPDVIGKSDIDDKAIHYRMGNKTINLLEEIGFVLEDTIVWDKGHSVSFHTNISSRPGSFVLTHRYENIYLLRKPGETDWSHLTEQDREASKLPSDFIGKYMFNLWQINSETQKTFHPAPFPLELAKVAVRMYSFTNEIAYDFFGGTGTVVKAAMELQRSGYMTELGYVPTKITPEGRVPDGTNWLDRTKAEIGWGNGNLASNEVLYYVLKTDGTLLEKNEVKGLGTDSLKSQVLHTKGANLGNFGLEIEDNKPEKIVLPEGGEEWKVKPEDWKKQKTL